eukprot:365216-Chlamydomonas_euryale.AAC.5
MGWRQRRHTHARGGDRGSTGMSRVATEAAHACAGRRQRRHPSTSCASSAPARATERPLSRTPASPGFAAQRSAHADTQPATAAVRLPASTLHDPHAPQSRMKARRAERNTVASAGESTAEQYPHPHTHPLLSLLFTLAFPDAITSTSSPKSQSLQTLNPVRTTYNHNPPPTHTRTRTHTQLHLISISLYAEMKRITGRRTYVKRGRPCSRAFSPQYICSMPACLPASLCAAGHHETHCNCNCNCDCNCNCNCDTDLHGHNIDEAHLAGSTRRRGPLRGFQTAKFCNCKLCNPAERWAPALRLPLQHRCDTMRVYSSPAACPVRKMPSEENAQ